MMGVWVVRLPPRRLRRRLRLAVCPVGQDAFGLNGGFRHEADAVGYSALVEFREAPGQAGTDCGECAAH
ncbi:hypothetical protein BST33_04700 [Mycolicibacter minnesotensis]|uniref:Uncharacterized protein n=1 Tax=Mycolicibacter minnesotensis TaxID=1118379 RepID=A0AA91M998_9MYCO|nr:hypothetical protein BST33_04700 [Mycolicibacter minnesotensis]